LLADFCLAGGHRLSATTSAPTFPAPVRGCPFGLSHLLVSAVTLGQAG
jgi:hypothetical protein